MADNEFEGFFQAVADTPVIAEKFCKGFNKGIEKIIEVSGLDPDKYEWKCEYRGDAWDDSDKSLSIDEKRVLVKAGVRKL